MRISSNFHRWALVIAIFGAASYSMLTDNREPRQPANTPAAALPLTPVAGDQRWAFAPAVLEYGKRQQDDQLRIAQNLFKDGILPALKGASAVITIPYIQDQVKKILRDLDSEPWEVIVWTERSRATGLGHGHISIWPPKVKVNVEIVSEIIRELNETAADQRWIWWAHYVVLVCTHDRYHYGIGSTRLPSKSPLAPLYEAETVYRHLKEIYRPLLGDLQPGVILDGLSELWAINAVPLPADPTPRDSTWEGWMNRFRPLVSE